MSSHIKDKIVGKMKDVLGTPGKMYVNHKVKKHSAQVDKDVAVIKDYRAMRDSKVSPTKADSKGATGINRKRAAYEMVKAKYQ